MSDLKRKLHIHNPIIASEMKVRMRTGKTPVGMVIYLLGLLIFMSIILFMNTRNYSYNSYNSSQIGLSVFMVLSIIQFFIIVLIAPSTTAGAISSEKEKQTFDLMLCTQMRPFKIIFGKLIASMSWIFLLLIASIPFYTVIFLYGGVTPLAILLCMVYYLICALCCGCIGLFYSVIFKKTVTGTVISYLTVFFLGIVTIITMYLEMYLHMNYVYS
ncbi:MAG: ABC transporter permease, partial [Clostridiales bacterium]|nr:ABC transporter permease [Clostridiales bacterium]